MKKLRLHMSRNRLLVGATGLIGSHCLQQLSSRGEAPKVLARRRPADFAGEENWHCETDLLATPESVFTGVDSVICALGTTQKTAGSRAAFAAVDRDLVLALAQKARAAGVRQWLQVSALGADANASVFYNRVKGEADAGLRALGFSRLDIIQPSLLLGERSEKRPGEKIAQHLMPLLNPLLRGPLRKMRPVPAEQVAEKMIALSQETDAGTFVHVMEP